MKKKINFLKKLFLLFVDKCGTFNTADVRMEKRKDDEKVFLVMKKIPLC